jgi:hypothetical protein
MVADLQAQQKGIKLDKGKPRWDLLPMQALRPVVRILTKALDKYPAPHNWQHVENHNRYWSALFRHLDQYYDGEQYDTETGESHLAHAICNLLFLLWFEIKKGSYIFRGNANGE